MTQEGGSRQPITSNPTLATMIRHPFKRYGRRYANTAKHTLRTHDRDIDGGIDTDHMARDTEVMNDRGLQIGVIVVVVGAIVFSAVPIIW